MGVGSLVGGSVRGIEQRAALGRRRLFWPRADSATVPLKE